MLMVFFKKRMSVTPCFACLPAGRMAGRPKGNKEAHLVRQKKRLRLFDTKGLRKIRYIKLFWKHSNKLYANRLTLFIHDDHIISFGIIHFYR